MLLALAAVFTSVCILAALVRMARVVEATPVDPASLAAGLAEPRVRSIPDLPARLRAWTGELPGGEWEHGLVDALSGPRHAQAALVGEALTELEFRASRWARVPRVCASLTSSFGFLLATAALRAGLSNVAGTADDATALTRAAFDAVDVMAIGLVGTAFCIAVLYRCRTAKSARVAGAERLIDVLERLVPTDGGALASADPRASVDALDAVGGGPPQIV